MKAILVFLIIIAVFRPQTVYAKFYLEQNSDSNKPVIAIVDLDSNSRKAKQLAADISQTVRDKISENMTVLSQYEMSDKDSSTYSADNIDFTLWRSTKADFFVKGVVKKDGESFIVKIRLFVNKTSEMLMGKQYKIDAVELGGAVAEKCAKDVTDAVREYIQQQLKAELDRVTAEENRRKEAELKEKRQREYANSPQAIVDEACGSQRMLIEALNVIANQRQIGALTGVVDNNALYSAGQMSVYASNRLQELKDKYIKKTGTELNFDKCNN